MWIGLDWVEIMKLWGRGLVKYVGSLLPCNVNIIRGYEPFAAYRKAKQRREKKAT